MLHISKVIYDKSLLIMELVLYLNYMLIINNFYACKDNTFVAMMQEKKREKY